MAKDKSNKIIKGFIIGIITVLILVIAVYFLISSLRTQTYEGVKFETVQFGQLIMYQTALPYFYQGAYVPYNIYLRNSPKKLKNIAFPDNFSLMKVSGATIPLNMTCDGDSTIALANLEILHNVIGAGWVIDNNATCDERYNLYKIVEADKTEIVEISPRCYEVRVANCEILPATERIMIEIFAKNAELNAPSK